MPRPQAPDYEDRKRAIVAAAAELFADQGFEGASLSALARRCNASKSLVYHYYPSKDELLFAVMTTHMGELNTALDAVDAEGGPAETKLRRVTRAWMQSYAGAAARHRVLIKELNSLSPARRYVIVAQQRRLLNRIGVYLGELQPRLQAKSPHARPAAMLYFGMINWTPTWFDPQGSTSTRELADFAMDLFLQGLGGILSGSERAA